MPNEISRRKLIATGAAAAAGAALGGLGVSTSRADDAPATPRNIVFILIDDLRYDAFGYKGHPFLETPHMDALAHGGADFANAFVTTSLCSPSRASILTGQFMHNHRVVNNQDLMPEGTVTFPQHLQDAGYETGFVGKWHMGGGSDAPRPGFDHWVSFRGQGNHFPNENTKLNINGEHVPQQGFMTDELTDYAVDWLSEGRSGEKPFFLYFSHKAVHGPFDSAPRHVGQYADAEVTPPATMADTPENYEGKPMWVRNQRNSWHGVDYPYHSSRDFESLYRNYCELVLSVDDSIGRVMDSLKQQGLDQDTLVVLMGDNGFFWGEHGLIDKRAAYEESMRVPMIAHCPELFGPNATVDEVVANIDIAPTLLDAAGVATPDAMDGESCLGLLTGEADVDEWRKHLLYEYYWEWSFPQTPTTFALRGYRYKLIQYHGVWDIDELYDLQDDPQETKNLISDPDHQQIVKQMRDELHGILVASGGAQIPFGQKHGHGNALRRAGGSAPAEFPPLLMRDGE
ncbi:MAG TPA: sulfatase [Armatimonadota bacterium]|nr:sulfatase [Armatimonadota bacterium]